MKKKIIYFSVFLLFFSAGYFIVSPGKEELVSIKRSEIIMGTIVDIQIDSVEQFRAEGLITGAFNELKETDSIFSVYNENGEVYRLNKSSDSLFHISSELSDLLKYSFEFNRISSGTFEPAINSLVYLWDFDNGRTEIPSEKEIKNAMIKTGLQNFQLKTNEILLRRNKAELNFGAIAKGYAVDKAHDFLKRKGVKKAIINAGGEIRVLGYNWIIGIQNPGTPESAVKINISNKAVATSGDYEKFYIIDGIKYHHILDPKNGYPSKGIQSVTVVSDKCFKSDALSTAVFVLGREKGLQLINSLPETECLLIDSEGRYHYSKNFTSAK